MGLPWARLDTNIYAHDKIINLLSDPSNKRHQACVSYLFSIAWSAGQGTDGFIPRAVLPLIQGSTSTARLLEKYGLWDEAVGGWRIRNFESRQELNIVAESKRAAQRAGALKGNCIRHHGPECGCWKRELEEAG